MSGELLASQLLPIFIALFLGIAISAAVVLTRAKTQIQAAGLEARNEGQTEIVRISERLSAKEAELGRTAEQIATLNDNEAKLRNDLETVRSEKARFEERAIRVETLDQQLAEALRKLDAVNETLLREKSHAAALAEQVSRIPQLQSALSESEQRAAALQEQVASLRETVSSAESTLRSQTERIAGLASDSAEIKNRRDQLIAECNGLIEQVATLSTTLDAERKQTAEKLELLEQAKGQLSDQFRLLANEILEEKTARFTQQNQSNIEQILEPLKTKIQEFQTQVKDAYINEGKERVVLSEQLKLVQELNQQLSDDAKALTCALKGSSKTQGDWGEMILERILEFSGLKKGIEYEAQQRYQREDGKWAQPDVIIHLPENRHLVVDSKVSLNAYEEYVNDEDDSSRQSALARHIASVRSHIDRLGEANYQSLYDVKTLDFVVMFVPIESAFMLAIANDASLWQYAWGKNVILVGPSTLLFTVRTIAHVWKQEYQNKHSEQIAARGAELYDKLVGFVADLEKVGEKLNQAKDSYDEARKKLAFGRGNLIRQAEMLKELGVNPTKALPAEIVEPALDESLDLEDQGVLSEPVTQV